MAKTGPISKSELIEKEGILLNALLRMNEEEEGRDVRLDDLRKNIDMGYDGLKQALGRLQHVVPRLFVWVNETTINVGNPTYCTARARAHQKLKERIADSVLGKVPAGTTVACSAGTTVTTCVRAMSKVRKQVFLLTNNVGVLEQSGVPSSLSVTFIGGEYSAETHSCIGSEVAQRFSQSNCRAALISVSGVNDIGELCVYHPDESAIHSVLATQTTTSRLIIAADATKLERPDRWCFSSLPDIHEQHSNREIILVTNSPSSTALSRSTAKSAAKIQETLQQRFGFLSVITAE